MKQAAILLITGISVLFGCRKESSGKNAAFVLDENSGPCTGYELNGAYKIGVPLDTSNTVSFSVSVTAPGNWSLSTTNEDGIAFSGTGNFTLAGTGVVTLYGTGVPSNTGDYILHVNNSNSDCGIGVIVDDTNKTAVQNAYWPLTYGSWWHWKNESPTPYESTNTIVGAALKLNKVYKQLGEKNQNSYSYFRCDGTGTYYVWQDTSYLSNVFYKDTTGYHGFTIHFSQNGYESKFLKNELKLNDSLITDINGKDDNDNPVILRNRFDVISVGETININGQNFSNVYHIAQTVWFKKGSDFISLTSPYDLYFAKGIGMVRTFEGIWNDLQEWEIK